MTVLERIKAALRRISPVWPSTETDTSVGKEIDSIAVAITEAATVLDGLLDEVFPDTTTQLIERWEKVARVPVRPADAIAARRTRILSVLRRTSGPRLDQLGKMLAGPFDLDENDIVFVETLRQFIDDALTETDTTGYALTTSVTTINLGKPWPGVVDATGVRLYLQRGSEVGGTTTVTLTSPEGTVWAVPYTGNAQWCETRTAFLGEAAGGMWALKVVQSIGGDSMIDIRLLVSNDVDSAQIYRFFALRDVSLAGSPDIVEGERLFHRTSLGHMEAHAIWRLEAICDDPYSRADREPCGE